MNTTALATRATPTITRGAAVGTNAGTPQIPVTAKRNSERPRVRATAAAVTPTTRPAESIPGMDRRELNRLAGAIDADGIGAHEQAVTTVLSLARGAGVCAVVVDVLADRAEPAVARERAFGRVAVELARFSG